jgi:hypothetical protein
MDSPVCSYRKGGKMRTSRDLNVCISSLEDLLRGGSVKPEKRKSLERVVDELKRIRRKPVMNRAEQHECMRTVVEQLIQTFMKLD